MIIKNGGQFGVALVLVGPDNNHTETNHGANEMGGHIRLTTKKIEGIDTPVIKYRRLGERGWKVMYEFMLDELVVNKNNTGYAVAASELGYHRRIRTFDEAMAKATEVFETIDKQGVWVAL